MASLGSMHEAYRQSEFNCRIVSQCVDMIDYFLIQTELPWAKFLSYSSYSQQLKHGIPCLPTVFSECQYQVVQQKKKEEERKSGILEHLWRQASDFVNFLEAQLPWELYPASLWGRLDRRGFSTYGLHKRQFCCYFFTNVLGSFIHSTQYLEITQISIIS